MSNAYFDGYISLHNREGVVQISVYDEAGFVSVFINNTLADDVDSKAYLSDEYGNRFYNSLEDYKTDDWIGIDSIWPKDGKVA